MITVTCDLHVGKGVSMVVLPSGMRRRAQTMRSPAQELRVFTPDAEPFAADWA